MATVTNIRENLAQMDTYMASIKSNITQFNEYVNGQVRALEARGQSSTYTWMNLMRGYRMDNDHTFTQYIELKNNTYEEEGKMTVDEIMNISEIKYKTLMQRGVWNSTTQEGEKIIALTTKITQLERTQSRPTKQMHPRKRKLLPKSVHQEIERTQSMHGNMSLQKQDRRKSRRASTHKNGAHTTRCWKHTPKMNAASSQEIRIRKKKAPKIPLPYKKHSPSSRKNRPPDWQARDS